jgi:hypothetical protein
MEQQEPEVTDDLQFATFVQVSRILDALYILLGPENGEKLKKHHEAGGLFSPDPYLVVPDEPA